MIRRWWLIGCVLVIVLVSAVLGNLPLARAQAESPYDLIARVNDYRVINGLSPLATDPALMQAAQSHVNWMAANSAPGHTGENGSTPTDRARAAGYQGRATENYTWGTSGRITIAWSMDWWKNSAIHNENLLSSATHIGAGIADNGTNTGYVLVFGFPSNPAPAAVTSDSGSDAPAAEPEVVPAVVAVPLEQATPRDDGAIVHVMQTGQTLWDVSVVYGVPLDDLLAINGLRRGAVVYPGDEIYVQLREGQEPPAHTHTVKEGESLWDIAILNGLTLDELLEYNGLARGSVIKPGDVLLLQPPPPTPTPTVTNTPLPTDTPVPSPTVPTATASPFYTTTPPPTIVPTKSATPTPTPIPTETLTPTQLPTETPTLAPSPTPAEVAAVPPTDDTPDSAPEEDDSGTDPLLYAGIALGMLGLAMMAGGVGLGIGLYMQQRRRL